MKTKTKLTISLIAGIISVLLSFALYGNVGAFISTLIRSFVIGFIITLVSIFLGIWFVGGKNE